MREAVFSSLGERVRGCRMLDLFAGTGAYGLEAWSRGAERVDWVEGDRTAGKALEANLGRVSKALGKDGATTAFRIHKQEVFSFLRGVDAGSWDLVIADPPYGEAPCTLPRIMEILGTGGFPAEGLFLAEAPVEWDGEAAGWECRKVLGGGKGAGRPTLRIFSPSGAD